MADPALKEDVQVATQGTTELEVVVRDLGIEVDEDELVSGVVDFFSGKISDVVDSTDEYGDLYDELWGLFGLNGTRVSQRVGEIADGLTGLWEVEDPAEKKAEVKRLLSALAAEVIQTREMALRVLDQYVDLEYEDQS